MHILVSRVCGLLLFVALCTAQRTRQLLAPASLFYTAEGIYDLAQSRNDTLYTVKMYYDYEMDRFWAGKLNDWNPPIQFFLLPNYWKQFLEPSSALGISGPLGPTGPLSSWGPVGNANWNPSGIISGGDGAWWTYWWNFFATWMGWDSKTVLGPQGPLGYKGPINKDQIYQVMYHLLQDGFLANDFNHNLDIHGVWGILGPLGPLGALGPLGPLGPVGAHNFTAGSDGQYRNSTGAIQRTVQQFWDSDRTISRVFELFEFYSRETAQALAEENDSSFMVEADLATPDSVDTYRFTSRRTQTVSALVIPIIEKISDTSAKFGDFNIAAAVAKGKSSTTFAVSALETAHSLPPTTQKGLVDYIVFRAQPGMVYELKVWAKLTKNSARRYRVIVTGSGFLQGKFGAESDADLFNHLNFEGPYLKM